MRRVSESVKCQGYTVLMEKIVMHIQAAYRIKMRIAIILAQYVACLAIHLLLVGDSVYLVDAGRWEQPISPEQVAAALKVVKKVALDRFGTPFAHPVSEDEAPGYCDYIRTPMDFQTITQRLQTSYYPSTGDSFVVPMYST